MEGLELAIVLTAAGAGLGGAFVASLAQMAKGVLPESWQTGRGILLVVYALSGLLVGAAMYATPELVPDNFAAAAFLGVFSWQGVAGAAIGANQIARKGELLLYGGTNPVGEDPRPKNDLTTGPEV